MASGATVIPTVFERRPRNAAARHRIAAGARRPRWTRRFMTTTIAATAPTLNQAGLQRCSESNESTVGEA